MVGPGVEPLYPQHLTLVPGANSCFNLFSDQMELFDAILPPIRQSPAIECVYLVSWSSRRIASYPLGLGLQGLALGLRLGQVERPLTP